MSQGKGKEVRREKACPVHDGCSEGQQQSGLGAEPGKVQVQEDFGSNLHKDDCCGTGS